MKAFDLTNICIGLLPVCLRRPVVCAVLRCAVSALQQQHDTIHTTHCGTCRLFIHCGSTYCGKHCCRQDSAYSF